MNWWQRLLHRPFFIRLLHWEYWSFHAVYLLIYPIWFFLCLRARSFFFFSASNPTFENGGFLMESKMKIYEILPPEFHPKTILIKPDENENSIRSKVRQNNFAYPLIAKPDIGGKGRGVKKIKTEDELVEYLKRFPVDMLVQEFVPFGQEVGIFYYRYPNEERGRISGIVGKHFLTAKGDGRSTIEEILKKDKRHILQLPALYELLGSEMNIVLEEGEERLLVPYGNHARGALFVDYSDWADEKLTEAIDGICKRIPGFYFGRLDVRFDTLEKLKEAKDFSLIEVNGAGSEPTHMYDPKHSLFYAWGEIIKHWRILNRVSRINHKNGVPYMSFKDGVKMFRDVREYDRILDSIL
ncbi:MAG TPA: hypothetical protein VJT83_03660 [Chitinophagaceae bacterium]|nr:hypothetical protein [Chitinophagaceae bacterium]